MITGYSIVRVFKGKQEPHRRQISIEKWSCQPPEGAETKDKITYLDSTLLGLNLGIADLTVIDNDRISAGTARRLIGPANALGKLGIRIREEKLFV